MIYDDETLLAMARFGDLFVAHCNLALDPKKAKAVSKRLAKQITDAFAQRDEAQAQRDAAKSEAAELVAKAHQEVAAIHAEAQRRLDAAETAEQDLRERERKISILENAWRGLGEGPDVWSGLRSPEFSPLQKARMAAGQQPGKDPDVYLFSAEPDAAPAVPIDALSDTASDPHADRHGAPFLGELTRDVSHKRRGAA